MTMTDVTKRMYQVLREQTNGESASLPMVSPADEIVFLYAASTGPGGFRLERVGPAGFRDLATSAIVARPAAELFSPAELAELTKPESVAFLSGDEARNAVAAYYDVHEQIVERGIAQVEVALLRAYLRAFAQIVPEGRLRKVYYRIGRAMFTAIEARLAGPARN